MSFEQDRHVSKILSLFHLDLPRAGLAIIFLRMKYEVRRFLDVIVPKHIQSWNVGTSCRGYTFDFTYFNLKIIFTDHHVDELDLINTREMLPRRLRL